MGLDPKILQLTLYVLYCDHLALNQVHTATYSLESGYKIPKCMITLI